jgi:hypothetical protein
MSDIAGIDIQLKPARLTRSTPPAFERCDWMKLSRDIFQEVSKDVDVRGRS